MVSGDLLLVTGSNVKCCVIGLRSTVILDVMVLFGVLLLCAGPLFSEGADSGVVTCFLLAVMGFGAGIVRSG